MQRVRADHRWGTSPHGRSGHGRWRATGARSGCTCVPLSATKARQVIAAAQTHRNSARRTVALAVGLRQSEALGLRWADVDPEKGALSVRLGLHRVGGQGLVYEEPKADRSRRTVALPAPLVEALRAHRAARLEERIAAGPLWQDHDSVFAQPNGRPIEHRCRRRRTPAATCDAALGRDAADRMGSALWTDLAPHPRQWPPRRHQRRLRPPPGTGDGLVIGVELRGLEPLTPTLPGRRDRVRRHPPTFATTPSAADSQGSGTAADGGEQPWIPGNCNQNCNHHELVRQRGRGRAGGVLARPRWITVGSCSGRAAPSRHHQ